MSPDLDRLRHAFDAQLADELEDAGPAFTRRRVFGQIRLPGKVTSVIGMRRAGKTTFLHQLRAEKIAGGTAPWRLPFLRLEDERFAGVDALSLGALIDEYASRYLESADAAPEAWLLDEIQVVPGWERLLRRLLDSRRSELYISGSSAALLSREIATELRGRGWKVAIYPFSFEEALRHEGTAQPPDPSAATEEETTRLESTFREWLATGGFPEAQGLPVAARLQLLRDYVDVAILRDVIDRYAVRNATGLRWLARHVLANAASPFSAERFHSRLKAQGIAISRDTVHDYLAYLEDCFLVRTVWIEADSERQRMVNPRKAYPVDAGLISAFDRSGRANRGHALETAILIELERRGCEVTYVRTPKGYEVDFLARSPDGELALIQVCADASNRDTASRESRALTDAGKRFPNARRCLLTLTRSGLPPELPRGIEAKPAYEWLLAASASLPEPAPAGWL